MNKHQYESAIFIGDKLLALTGRTQYSHQFYNNNPVSCDFTDMSAWLSTYLQMIQRTHSGLPKCTSVPDIIHGRKGSLCGKTSSRSPQPVNTSLLSV